jgi:carboxypeptidase T
MVHFRILLAGLLVSAFSISALSDDSRYEAIRQSMRKAVVGNPSTAKGFNIGISDSGKPIEGVQIGNGPVKTLVVATHHGNEYGSTYVASQFIDAMAGHPIPGRTIYVIPVLNINGYNAGNRYEPIGGGEQRQDPNRDYPNPCGSDGPFALKSTHHLATFIDEAKISSSLTLHTYMPLVAYPWGMGRNFTDPYLDIYKKLASFTVEFSGYDIGNSAQAIYPANGTFEDYAFWKHGIWSLLMELGTSHNPSQADLVKMAKVNIPGMVKFLEQAPAERAMNHEYDGDCSRRLIDRHLE